MRVSVKVRAKAKQNKIAVQEDGSLKAYVTAAPEKGKANLAVAALISEHYSCRKTDVVLVHGATSPEKVFHIPDR